MSRETFLSPSEAICCMCMFIRSASHSRPFGHFQAVVVAVFFITFLDIFAGKMPETYDMMNFTIYIINCIQMWKKRIHSALIWNALKTQFLFNLISGWMTKIKKKNSNNTLIEITVIISENDILIKFMQNVDASTSKQLN